MSQQQFELAFEEAAKELAFDGKLDNGSARIVSSVLGVPHVNVMYLGEEDLVVFFAKIGHVPEEDLALYREFLEDAFMLRGTRGATFAVDPADGALTLQREIPADRVDGKTLATALGDFAEVGFKARRRLYRKAEAEDPSPEVPGLPQEEPSGADLGAFRV